MMLFKYTKAFFIKPLLLDLVLCKVKQTGSLLQDLKNPFPLSPEFGSSLPLVCPLNCTASSAPNCPGLLTHSSASSAGKSCPCEPCTCPAEPPPMFPRGLIIFPTDGGLNSCLNRGPVPSQPGCGGVPCHSGHLSRPAGLCSRRS